MKRNSFSNVFLVLMSILLINCNSLKDNRSLEVIKLKGKSESCVIHWDVVTIGNLSRNRYWGESEERSLHSVICTTTIIRLNDHNIIVDPSLKDREEMEAELKRRTGLSLNDIDVVFITHEHGDHHAGISNFPNAKWLANPLAAEIINEKNNYIKKVEPAGNKLFDCIDVIPAPGHTPGTSGLRFDYKGLSIFVAGDAVATKDFWDDKRMYFKALDIAESLRTYKKIESLSNIVVPGHDNYFFIGF